MVIGRIEISSDGTQRLFHPDGRFCGSYDPRTNKTEDKYGALGRTGNLLITLL